MKDGEYAIYKGNEYTIYNGELDNKNVILLLSHDRTDLKRGFKSSYSEEYMQRYDFFTCEKEVPKSEITEAYEIRTHAVYKGVSASIMRSLKPNCILLVAPYLYWLDGDRDEYLKKVTNAGFEYTTTEQGGYEIYEKEVSLDDPDLELIEERTEIDISKL